MRKQPESWRCKAAVALAALLCACHAAAGEFGTPGGPPPANVEAIVEELRRDPYDLELLVSYGTSNGGSAGHLALAIREGGDEPVYSANFYADRDPQHAAAFLTEPLMLRIPKAEYLWGTASSLGQKASFGLDFGEIYKRSVIGIRVTGVPAAEKAALAAYFGRINDDFRRRAHDTEYHQGEVRYDYLRLNCAKTIGAAFKYGAGYEALEVDSARLFSRRRLVAALNANIPTEMALKLMDEWQARGYGIDMVLYRKYPASNWVDPQDEEKIAFRDLPDRFPSVLSRDFRRDAGEYEDADNLFAMYLLYNLGRASVRVDAGTRLLEIAHRKTPLPYAQAAERARASAQPDSEDYAQQHSFRPRGTRVGVD